MNPGFFNLPDGGGGWDALRQDLFIREPLQNLRVRADICVNAYVNTMNHDETSTHPGIKESMLRSTLGAFVNEDDKAQARIVKVTPRMCTFFGYGGQDFIYLYHSPSPHIGLILLTCFVPDQNDFDTRHRYGLSNNPSLSFNYYPSDEYMEL